MVNGWVLFIDLDGLKKINDNFGHKKGDEILKKFGKKLMKYSCFKAFRYGGDEFIVLGFFKKEDNLREMLVKIKKETEVEFSYGLAKKEEEADKEMYKMKSFPKGR